MGFKYPVVDSEKCIGCGLCDCVCAFQHDIGKAMKGEPPGGASYLLMRHFVESGGIVFGAGFVDHFRVAHKRAETLEEM